MKHGGGCELVREEGWGGGYGSGGEDNTNDG